MDSLSLPPHASWFWRRALYYRLYRLQPPQEAPERLSLAGKAWATSGSSMLEQILTPLNLFLLGILALIVTFGTIGVLSRGREDHRRKQGHAVS